MVRENEWEKRNSVWHLSLALILVYNKTQIGTLSVSLSAPLSPLSLLTVFPFLFVSPPSWLCAAERNATLPGSTLSHYHILITFVKGSIWEFNEYI